MSTTKAAITGVAGFLPPDVMTNEDLAKIVDTSDEWITSRTGIRQRHILKGENKATSDMGAEAVKELLKKTSTAVEEVDLLICATVTPDMVFPDTANTILDKIGAKNAFGYDLSAACSGFLYALMTGSKFIESNTYKKVIVVGADMMSSIVDYTDRTTCVIFGDGAAAVMLEPSQNGFGIEDAILKSDGSGREFLHMKAGGSLRPSSHATVDAKEHFVYQDGRTVFKAAVTGMANTVKDIIANNGLTPADISWVVPHQANIRIINAVADMMDFPHEKVMVNIQNYGNTTAATIPLCLRDYEPRLKKGDKIVLTAFGGGFTWGSIYLTWAYDGQ